MVEAVAVSLTTGGRRSVAGGPHAALDACAYADDDGARADTGASRARAYATEGQAVRWSRCEWGR